MDFFCDACPHHASALSRGVALARTARCPSCSRCVGIKAAVADAEEHAEHQTFAGVAVPAVLNHAGRESVVSICSCMPCSTCSVSVHGRAVEDKVRLCCAIVFSNARNNVTSSLLSAPSLRVAGRGAHSHCALRVGPDETDGVQGQDTNSSHLFCAGGVSACGAVAGRGPAGLRPARPQDRGSAPSGAPPNWHRA